MPQPLSSGYTLQRKPKLLLEYMEHAAGIGLVAAEWAALEDELLHSFTFAMFAFSKTEHGAMNITSSILGEVDNLHTRLAMIQTVIRNRVPREFLSEFDELCREIRKRAKERNVVTHGHWHVCNKYPNEIICMPPGEEPMRYSVKDFHDIAERIIDTSNRISTFWYAVQERLHPFPKHLLPPLPEQ